MPHQPKRRAKPTAKCHTSFKKTPNAAVGTVENLEDNRGREREREDKKNTLAIDNKLNGQIRGQQRTCGATHIQSLQQLN